MSEWLSTSLCYSMPWIRLPKLQCQAEHLQLLCIRREKWNWGCSTQLLCLHSKKFQQPSGELREKSLLSSLSALSDAHVGAICATTATESKTSRTTSSQALPCQALLQNAMNNCHKYGSKPSWTQHHPPPLPCPATSASPCHLLTLHQPHASLHPLSAAP